MYRISLYTPGYPDLILLNPAPNGPIRRVRYTPPGGSGEEIVDESLLLDLTGTPSEIEAAQSSLENRLNLMGEHRRRATGVQTCLQVLPEEGGADWNSPVVEGRLAVAGGDARRGSLGLEMCLKRKNYWEASSEQAVPLTNRNGARVTGGLVVWNHRDGGAGHDNYVSIEGADILGDLPSPLRLDVFDLSSAIPGNEDLLVAQSLFAATAALPTVVECGGSASSACSNSDYTALTVSSETRLLDKALEAGFVLAANGGFFKPLLKLKDSIPVSDVWLKVRVTDAAGLVLHDSPWGLAAPNENVVELGTVQIPPRLTGSDFTSIASLRLEVWGKKATGSQSLNVDYILLAPLDGYRRYEALPNTTWQNASLIDDGYSRLVYRIDAAGMNVLPAFNVYGDPLRLIPGQSTAFHFQLAGTNISQIDRQMRIRIGYRPRKRRV